MRYGQACPIPQQSGVVDPGVKVNGQYYQDILLTTDLLPDNTQYSDYFTFQHCGGANVFPSNSDVNF